MTGIIASDNKVLIVGGGLTGLSVARFLEKKGQRYDVFDTRSKESVRESFQLINPGVKCFLGDPSELDLTIYAEIILSPGISYDDAVVQLAIEKDISIIGDVTLFLRYADAPVIGITGSNGKSTVTTMVGLACEKAGLNAGVGGNLGIPALDLLSHDVDIYVLEISSFQLESTENPGLRVAANLNISPDHMDRHKTLETYFRVKQKIFHGAESVVYNLNDPLTQPPLVGNVIRYGFGLSENVEKREIQYFYIDSSQALMRDDTQLMAKSEIKQKGLHNLENILAVIAICEAAGIDARYAIAVASEFPGLAHRCEFVGEINGVTFVNDSKATNVGAAIAAIRGFKSEVDSIYLIAGGAGKGADFSELAEEISKSVACAVLIGEDAPEIERAIADGAKTKRASSLAEAVSDAFLMAHKGSMVLLSPACASFDMFTGFEDRGEQFRAEVRRLAV